MSISDVHCTRNGRALCGARPRVNGVFRSKPEYRGTDGVDCAACLRRASRTPGLSARQEQVRDLVLQGKTTREIAFELDLCDWTVKSHKQAVFRHYGVSGMGASARLVEKLSAEWVR